MSCPINPEHITAFKTFINACIVNPQILNTPQLDFFKEFIESLGGKVPAPNFEIPKPDFFSQSHQSKPTTETTEPIIESDPESDVELDTEGCVPADTDEPHEMGDESKIVTDEDMDKASDFRSKAAAAYSNQEYETAISLYTGAIKEYPTNALFFAKRGQVFLKLTKPNACIRDCNRALELNCDSAAAYKFRGRAHRLLGNWEDAAKDLRQACKIDFDEETDEWLREVTPNAKKLEQHRIKQDRKKKEKELKKKQERVRQAQESHRRASEENKSKFESSASAGGAGPGFGGGAGFGGGMNFADIFTKAGVDMEDFNDPEVYAALMDITQNPANIKKYKDNPKITQLFNKFKNAANSGAMPGFTGGMPPNFGGAGGGMPNFGGGAGAMPNFGGPGGMPNFGGFQTSNSEPSAPSEPQPKTKLRDEDLD